MTNEEFMTLWDEVKAQGGGLDSLHRGQPCSLCHQPVAWPEVLHRACLVKEYGKPADQSASQRGRQATLTSMAAQQ